MKAPAFTLAALLALTSPALARAQGPEVQDFNFYNTDLDLVLKALAEITNVTFVEDVPVSGKITIHIARRTGLEEVLETILKPLGLEWRVAGNVYHIGLKPGKLPVRERPGYVQQAYSLQYVAAGEAARRLRKFLRARGFVGVDLARNRITVTVPPALLTDVENIVKAADVDVAKKLVSIRIKLVEITRDKTFDSESSLEHYDYQASLGITGTFNNSLTHPERGAGENTVFYNNALTYRVGGAGIDQFVARLKIASNSNRVETISEPDVVILDGKEANITMGEKVPRDKLNKYELVGNIVKVTPVIKKDGYIELKVDTTLTRRKNLTSNSQTQIDLTKRSIRTTLTLLNGDTGRLGGLLSQSDNVVETKIPLLGDLPLLGFLFKSRSTSTSRKELVVLISPSIVEDVPPHGRRTAGISALAAWLIPGTTHVVLDWSEDVPVDNVGVFQYRIYRDVRPISSIARLVPITDTVSRAATSWVDETPKRRGVTYYYAVIAVDGAGNKQAVSNSPAITIPRR